MTSWKLSKNWSILRESSSGDLVCYVRQGHFNTIDGIILAKDTVENAIKAASNDQDPQEVLHEKGEAIISLNKPDDPCNGAMEVKKVAVAKHQKGDLAYGLGYWLSRTGSLVPDRSAVTNKAANAWLNQAEKGTSSKLDDVDDPRNNDPNDDCQLWWGDDSGRLNRLNVRDQHDLPLKYADALNRSYERSPRHDYNSMINLGKSLFDDVSDDIKSDVMGAVWQEFDNLFNSRMSE